MLGNLINIYHKILETMKTIYFETIGQQKEHLFFAILKEMLQSQNGSQTKQENKNNITI